MQTTQIPAHLEDAKPRAEARALQEATQIRAVTRGESYQMARHEFALLMTVIQSISGDEWERATACSLWDVKRMVSHLAGALAGYASWAEFKRQYNPMSHRPYKSKSNEMVDRINAVQVSDRQGRTSEELISELLAVGPRALATRSRIPVPVRLLPMPAGAFGFISMAYLLDVIYPRDMWMHRLDLCSALGRKMVLTPEHDGRVVALVMRDLAHALAPKLAGGSVLYDLKGEAGGMFKVSKHPSHSVSATITMDALDFNVLASGRMTVDQADAHNLFEIEGDTKLARFALTNTRVLY